MGPSMLEKLGQESCRVHGTQRRNPLPAEKTLRDLELGMGFHSVSPPGCTAV